MYLLVIAFLAWFIAQLVKFSIKAFKGTPNFRLFYQSGGMPSAHAATVVALATAALVVEGYQSPIFGLSAALAAIVIYDSFGVRRSSGEQSVVINALIKATGNIKPVREVLGHTPAEVAVGASLGLITGLLLTFSEWANEVGWLAMSPTATERWLYLGLFGLIVVLALIKRAVLSRYRTVAVTNQLKVVLWWSIALPGAIGLFTSLLQFQTNGSATWRLWPLLVIVAFAAMQVVLSLRLYRFVKPRYEEQTARLRRKRREARRRQKQNRKSQSRK